MNFRNISAWSIRNPVPPLVIFIALLLAGVVSFARMQVNQSPDIDFPAAIVLVTQPGAAPTELETQVTQRVEAALRGVSGVDEINSTVSEGQSQTFVQFQIGTPVDRAVNDVRDAVSNIRSDLPEGILEPQVQRVDITGEPIAYIAAASTDMTLEELSWYVDNTISKRLLSVPGMAAVNRGGGVTREIRVTLDPARMQSFGVTAAQINQQLRQVNLNAAGGRAEIAGAEQSVRVLGNARDAYALGETEISLGGGRRVRLSDVATVRDAYAEQRNLSKMDGRQVLSFSLERAKGSSEVSVHAEAMKVLKQIEKENPKIRFTELFNSVDYTKEQYTSAMTAMIEGAVLAVIVVFLFLRDWRATAISAVAIPLSAIPAFWFMSTWLGFTLNELSLLALSLVAGVLVDDAIVEIENIVRHMRMGKSAYQASIDAADEIGLAVVATTMTIVAVFLPVGLMPGVSGQFFKNFGLTVVVAVLMSLAVARMITPMMAAYFLKSHGEESHGEGWMMDRYMGILRWTLANRWWTMAIGAVALVLEVVVFSMIPFQFQPPQDRNYSQIRIELAPGTTLKQTEEVSDRVRGIVAQSPDVQAAFQRIQVGSSNIYLRLKADRSMSSTDFERKWGPQIADTADARVNFQSQSGGGPGGGGRDVNVHLGGDDPAALNAVANRLVAEMATIPGLRAPRVYGDLQRPEIVITPRLDLAADLGVTTSALSQTIRLATIGDIDQNSAKFSLSDRQIPIRVTLPEESRRNLSTLENLPVPTSTGGTVPLKVVADIRFGAGPTTVQRSMQKRRISVGADLAPGKVSGDVQPLIDALPAMKNLPQDVQILKLGDTKWIAELVVNFVIAVISGIMMVFGVLVLLYRRIMPPLVNMASLLIAPLGGGIALLIAGDAISMPVMIGILMLLGIVGKNSILLVDFAIEEMSKGVDKFTAIVDAGHKRAQPILMTTVAMVAGMIPVALSLSGDGSWRAPMGVTVIGGLIVSTMLTLLIVPASFSLADGVEKRIGPWLGYYLTNHGEKSIEKPPSLFPQRLRDRFRRRPPESIQPAE